jgi:hypothetical protein
MNARQVARRNTRELSRNERVQMLIYLVVLVGLALGAKVIITDVSPTINPRCNYGEPLLPAPWIPLVGGVGLVAGRYFNRLRGDPEARDLAGAEKTWAALTGPSAIMLVFLALSGIWFFEAMGTAKVLVHETGRAVWQPMTYYVRCAAYVDRADNVVGIWTMVMVFLICGLAGHWFWSSHRTLADQRGPGRRFT